MFSCTLLNFTFKSINLFSIISRSSCLSIAFDNPFFVRVKRRFAVVRSCLVASMLAMVRSTKTKLALPKTNIYMSISHFMSQNSLSKANVNQLSSNSLTLPFNLKNDTSSRLCKRHFQSNALGI